MTARQQDATLVPEGIGTCQSCKMYLQHLLGGIVADFGRFKA